MLILFCPNLCLRNFDLVFRSYLMNDGYQRWVILTLDFWAGALV